jgi:cobalt/nickel transport system permease protein
VTRLFRQLDPRTRVLSVVIATVIIVSTPRGVLLPFAAYFLLCVLFVSTETVSGGYLILRCLAASPFILLAGGLLALQGGFREDGFPLHLPAGVSVIFKGYAAVLLLAFLTYSTPLSELLSALRRLGSPDSLNLILGMMHRYTSLFTEEYARMERARLARTARPLGRVRYHIYGRQLGALVLRSWDRAERVHAAMMARGFNGVWPAEEPRPMRFTDFAFLTSTFVLFLAPRFLLG